ncbi:hypothetical protein H5410_033007, partial [Solanum commersonii]
MNSDLMTTSRQLHHWFGLDWMSEQNLWFHLEELQNLEGTRRKVLFLMGFIFIFRLMFINRTISHLINMAELIFCLSHINITCQSTNISTCFRKNGGTTKLLELLGRWIRLMLQ